MPDTRYEPTLPPVSATATRVLLIGEPSPLRSAVARQLRTNTVLLACLDARSELPPALLSAAIGAETEPAGATVVFVTVPRPPGLATRLRHRFQFPALAAAFSRAVTTARRHGAARVIAPTNRVPSMAALVSATRPTTARAMMPPCRMTPARTAAASAMTIKARPLIWGGSVWVAEPWRVAALVCH